MTEQQLSVKVCKLTECSASMLRALEWHQGRCRSENWYVIQMSFEVRG